MLQIAWLLSLTLSQYLMLFHLLENEIIEECFTEMNETEIHKDSFTIIYHVGTFDFATFEMILHAVTEKPVYKFKVHF